MYELLKPLLQDNPLLHCLSVCSQQSYFHQIMAKDPVFVEYDLK